MSNFGYSLVEDPGGEQLLREAEAKNVESHSRVVINPGFGCLAIVDGVAYIYTTSGRFPIYTGLNPYFSALQNIVSKGKSTHTSNFYYYDTDPNVYRDISFTVPDLFCRDVETQLQGQCNPMINISVRIADPDVFFHIIKGFDLKNNAIGNFLNKRIAPQVRQELYVTIAEEPLIAVNANACNFSTFLHSNVTKMLDGFGLEASSVQIANLGISTDFAKAMEEYHSRTSLADQEAVIIKKYATELFNGDVQKASNYLLLTKGMEKDGQGFNPFEWEIMKRLFSGND